jgi:uncharacterized protein with FMN-binding domain
MERNSKQDLIVTLSVLLVVVFVVTGVILNNKKISSAVSGGEAITSTPLATTTTAVAAHTPPDVSITSTTASSTSQYKDGIYSSTSSFETPGDNADITVKVLLQNGVITDTETSVSSGSRESRYYASEFVNSYKSLVVGKSLADIRLSRVSGASLTTQGFNQAITLIQTQAQV